MVQVLAPTLAFQERATEFTPGVAVSDVGAARMLVLLNRKPELARAI